MVSALLFAKTILYDPLCEYARASRWPVEWVQEYSLSECLPLVIKSEAKHVIFLQRGPHTDLFQHLTTSNILVSILNTEQMTRYIAQNAGEQVFFPFDAFLMSYIQSQKLFSIIDYSTENIAIWKKCFPKLITALECFNGYSTLIDYKKNADVVFVGDVSSAYRQKIIQSMRTTVVSGIYGHKRDAIVFSHRILLNVHFGTAYTIFEELRCLPCVLNQMIVVSEESKFDQNHPLHKFIIFAPYQDLAKVVAHTLTNYEAIFKKMFITNEHFANLQKDIQNYNESYLSGL